MKQPVSPPGRRSYVVGCDVREDIRVFSGSTHHLVQQGIEDGLLTGMINLHPKGVADWRVYLRAGLWKLSGGVHGRHGFIFTNQYLDGVWKRKLATLRDSIVINNFQLFGPHFLQWHEAFGIEPYNYIDATLTEYFANYRAFDAANVDETARRQALMTEREGYAACAKVVVMSKRTAANIIQQYSIPECKVHIVPPGANIPERVLDRRKSQAPRYWRPGERAFVIGFIGVYPERKGLPTIAAAVRRLRQTGYDVRLHVIGKCPPQIAQQDGIRHFGVIDKKTDIDRFIEIVSNIDLGCMLSRAENAGVALLEFLRMGIPIIGTDVGGIPDILELGAGQLVSPGISADDLAKHIARLMDEPDQVAELKQNAWRRRHNASWRRVVRELGGILRQ